MYIGQWCLSALQISHLGTSHSSLNGHQLPYPIFLNLIEGLKSFPFQRWFQFWEKPEVTGCQIWGVGAWATWVIWCLAKNVCMRHDAWVSLLLWWSCQSPVARSYGLLNNLNRFCFMQNLVQIHCSTHSVILNATATQYIYSLNSIYSPTDYYSEVVIVHMCTFQSTLLVCQFTLMSCKLLSLTLAGLFPDRPCMYRNTDNGVRIARESGGPW